MNEAALVGLLNNAALLMALVLLFDLDFMRKRTPRVYIQSIAGIIVGLLGIGVMLAPWEFAPGVYLDTRSVLLSVAGLHFGAVPTAIAVVITVAFRLLRGGPGVAAGIIVIVTSGAIGVAWRHVRHRFDRLVPAIELYLLGFMIHVPTLIFLTLTDSAAAGLATEAAIACLIGYPVTTILVGSLLNARQSRHAAEAFVARRQVYDQAMARNLSALRRHRRPGHGDQRVARPGGPVVPRGSRARLPTASRWRDHRRDPRVVRPRRGAADRHDVWRARCRHRLVVLALHQG